MVNNITRGIILAAGQGSRLYPYTKDIPKCLVKLGKYTLLEYQIRSLCRIGIEDIIVIGGYKYEKLSDQDCRLVINPFWNTTNMVSTLFCAREFMEEDFIVSYSDIVYGVEVVSKLLEDSADIGVVIDKDWLSLWKVRFDDMLSNAESLRLDEMGNIVDVGKKISDLHEAEGQYIGLLKFCGEGRIKMLKFYEQLQKKDRKEFCELSPSEKLRKMYMTDFLQLMIDNSIRIKAVPIHRKWLEVDTRNDYETYSRMYQEGVLKEFIDIS